MKKVLVSLVILMLFISPCFADYFSNSRGTNLNTKSYGESLHTRERLEASRDDAMRQRNYEDVNRYNQELDSYYRQRNTYQNNSQRKLDRIY